MEIIIREYSESKDLKEMIKIWNEVVEEADIYAMQVML